MGNKQEERANIGNKLLIAGSIFIALSFLLLIFTYYPLLTEEIKYFFMRGSNEKSVSIEKNNNKNSIIPADENFSIIIPKINANSKIVKNVDPLNYSEYSQKLKEGIAHAKGTVYPGMKGNVFLFAHSSDNFYNASRYNTVFYLLGKLEKEDQFTLVYNKKIYNYKVTDSKIVSPDAVDYLSKDAEIKKVTLMTCWPIGTTWKRLLVIGEQIE